ncbi:hypothetical protein N6H14_26245 [Paenibacillus sp. CC-CFT747]|nr:hypothetical protein N6H14_26245 [Paenibacillus sp. CC-CFT747]
MGKVALTPPICHVFDMFKIHQDAELLPVDFESPDYTFAGETISQVSASVSADPDGEVHLTLGNLRRS